ncbi:MAG: VCBS repeat-containing protein [Cytophagales bacterium]|nr:VCBS repeat-containing protein [Cytophagales bacterium]
MSDSSLERVTPRYINTQVLALFTVLVGLMSCQKPTESATVFRKISPTESGIDFRNQLEYNERLNTYTYRNFYNGAGVAVGDINNDGLQDLYFCGNQVDNKLFLNLGNLKFKDITQEAGVGSPNIWSTGVSMADVNGDGLLDIYVCKAGPKGGENRHNELFINQGDLTFTEESKKYGIADEGLSLHAAFFDYDKDGDQDFYLLNNSLRSVGVYDLRQDQRLETDTLGGNKLYRNDGGYFTNVTLESGIYSSFIGFGLGVTIADLDRDGWQDIFVSNDFFEKDYVYINQGNGTFEESLEALISETSMGSMGADIADLNNDGYPEIYVTEMLPESEQRYKTKTLFEDWDKYQSNLKNGYYEQFTRNAFQLNNGPNPVSGSVSFSEISRLTGAHATDWSWGALIFDYNNDGFKDIFVANGIAKDLTDLDYINFYSNNRELVAKYRKDSLVLTKLIDQIPSVPLPNYLFENSGGMDFNNRAIELGLSDSTFSNGAVYSDLDNDGDLDLVVNNINDDSFLFENTSESNGNHYLMLDLRLPDSSIAVGAQVEIRINNQLMYQELVPVKGYLSSVDPRMHFGVGTAQQVGELKISWPNGATSTETNIAVDQLLKRVQPPLTPTLGNPFTVDPLMTEIKTPVGFQHIENDFEDFNRDRLLFEMHSNEGPGVAQGDVNGDGLTDLYLGGAKGFAGGLYLQEKDGSFSKSQTFTDDQDAEDVDALFFDADQDGDLDLYVASGGNEFGVGSKWLMDRIYFNDGNGRFIKKASSFPGIRESSSFVSAADFDGDGDADLLVGTRLKPFLYGVPPNSYLLQNDGSGNFKDITASTAPALQKIGMATDGQWFDLENDGDQDIVLVGKWMGVKVLTNESGKFTLQSKALNLAGSNGLWNTLEVADLNQDGYQDLIAGNIGENTRYRASVDKPLQLFINDFDRNGSVEQITCQYEGDKAYPIHLLANLTKQLPGLRKRFSRAEDYKSKTMEELFTPEQMANAVKLKVETLQSSAFISQQGTSFIREALPDNHQIAPIYGLLPLDLNADGRTDLITGGNFTKSKPEWGIYKASYGNVSLGTPTNQWQSQRHEASGFFVTGEVRRIIALKDSKRILVVRNNSGISCFSYE